MAVNKSNFAFHGFDIYAFFGGWGGGGGVHKTVL